MTFDDVLINSIYVLLNEDDYDLAKFDCEGCEYSLLLASRVFTQVYRIAQSYAHRAHVCLQIVSFKVSFCKMGGKRAHTP